VDDEFLARQLLSGYIEKVPFLELVGKCENAFEVMSILETEKIDLLFLDINMPDLNGINFIKTLKNRPEIIITTAYSEYAVEGYQLDVIEYLLKPIFFDRFVQASTKAKDMISLKKSAQSATKTIFSLPKLEDTYPYEASQEDKYFFIKTGSQKIVRIHFDDIIYIESLHEYVRIHLHSEKHIIYHSLKNMLECLPAQQFIQIHRSHIVNFDKIDAIEGPIIKARGVELRIGKNYRDDLFNRIKVQGIGMNMGRRKEEEKMKVF
jgi:DNA-binding LytR/AlgR family response regulator